MAVNGNLQNMQSNYLMSNPKQNLEQRIDPINPFQTSKDESGEQLNVFQYRIPRSMVQGGAYYMALFSIASEIDVLKGRMEHFPHPYWITATFFTGTILIYGTSLIRDGIRKLRNKEYQPFSWFL